MFAIVANSLDHVALIGTRTDCNCPQRQMAFTPHRDLWPSPIKLFNLFVHNLKNLFLILSLGDDNTICIFVQIILVFPI